MGEDRTENEVHISASITCGDLGALAIGAASSLFHRVGGVGRAAFS